MIDSEHRCDIWKTVISTLLYFLIQVSLHIAVTLLCGLYDHLCIVYFLVSTMFFHITHSHTINILFAASVLIWSVVFNHTFPQRSIHFISCNLITYMFYCLSRWWLSRRGQESATCGRLLAASLLLCPSLSLSLTVLHVWHVWREHRCRWVTTRYCWLVCVCNKSSV